MIGIDLERAVRLVSSGAGFDTDITYSNPINEKYQPRLKPERAIGQTDARTGQPVNVDFARGCSNVTTSVAPFIRGDSVKLRVAVPAADPPDNKLRLDQA